MSEQAAENIRMTPEQEQAALETARTDEGTEPADEGVGVLTDAAEDGEAAERTEN